jgi:arylsulfatase A
MVHFTDYFPTLLEAAGLDATEHAATPELPIDGVNVLPTLRGDSRHEEPTRCWQWNRYEPVITSNAAIRDGDWKLVRPAIGEAMAVPDIRHLRTSMYETEYFIENGIFEGGPDRKIPDPPPAELYNIAEDPLEADDRAAREPERATRLLSKLEAWFQSVEADRASIDDEWVLNDESGW